MKYREALQLAQKNVSETSTKCDNDKNSTKNVDKNPSGIVNKDAVRQYLQRKQREKQGEQKSKESAATKPSTSVVTRPVKDDDIFALAKRRRELLKSQQEHEAAGREFLINEEQHQHFMTQVNKLSEPSSSKMSDRTKMNSFQKMMITAAEKLANGNEKSTDSVSQSSGLQQKDAHRKLQKLKSKPSKPEYPRSYLETRKRELVSELERVNSMLQQWDDIEFYKISKKNAKKRKHNSVESGYSKTAAVSQVASSVGRSHSSSAIHSRNAYGSSDDNDEDADSFIDDTGDTGADNYHEIVREVHKSLKFDPRKYAHIDPHDDCRNMVSSFKDVEREEKRSMRIGAREDHDDVLAEEQKKRRRLEKKHKR